jgi:glycosyltransferase involved in cell wall biosynthesis
MASRELEAVGEVHELPFTAITFPDSLASAPSHLRGLSGQVGVFGAHFTHTKPDLVMTSSMMLPSAVRAARREGIPVLVHCSVLLNSERLPSRLKRSAGDFLIERTAAWSTALVACSRTAAEQFDGTSAQAEVAYPPIPDLRGEGDGAAFRREHGVPAREPCIAMVGNVSRGRGQDVLVRAMAELRDRFPAARCLLVGAPFDRPRDLAYQERLVNLIKGLGLERSVSFTGPLERIADVYDAADVVVNPARVPESFGRVACEALVAGAPVVSTSVGAVEEVLQDGKTALLVPPEDPVALAAAIAETIEHPEPAAERVSAGRDEVLARFAPAPLAARFTEIVEAALEGNQVPEPHAAHRAPAPRPTPDAEAPA